MIGAVMLLMAATVGITYGWTPDGGDGVKYIIQIPPEKIDQVARSGEISSQIPVEIRGRVSEVVIRVGQGNLPRVTPGNLFSRSAPAGPSNTMSGNANSLAAADQIPVPIPSMGDPTDMRPIGMGDTAPTAMMKPAPQGSGMNMPNAFGMPPAVTTGSTGFASTPPANTGYSNASLEQAARDAGNSVAQQYSAATEAGRQQLQQNVNAVTGRMGDAANAQFQSATSGLQNATNELLYGPTLPPSTPDDPRARLGPSGSATGSSMAGAPMTGPSMTGSSTANGPSTSPYTSGSDSRIGLGSAPSTSGSPSSSSFGSPPNFANSAPSAFGPSTTAPSTSAPSTFGPSTSAGTRAVATPPMNASNRDEDWYALQNKAGNRPSTAPTESSTGGFSSSTFGQMPNGLQPATNPPSSRPTATNYTSSGYGDGGRQTATTRSDLDYDPNLSPTQAARLPKNGYSYDAQGYPVDRQGYRVDHYGRRVDSQGHLLTAVDTMSGTDPNAGGAGNYTNSGSDYANNRPPQNASTAPLVQPPRSPTSTPDRVGDGYRPDTEPRFAGVNGATGNVTSAGWNDGRPRVAEDILPSASDGQVRRDVKEPSRAGGYSELDSGSEQVAAQPIFNALLLLSVVANVYLLFWLKNMREQFRDIVATKRAATSGGSLATGI